MMLIVLPLLLVIAISLFLNFYLIDIIHKLDANIEEDSDTYGWTTESLESEVKELRRQNENLQRQNDFLIGRM